MCFLKKKHKILLRGFDDKFYAPHSRHTETRESDIVKVPELEILSKSDEAGVYIVSAKSGRQFFVTGHSEYDNITLANEYFRDKAKGIDINLPKNYFPDNESIKRTSYDVAFSRKLIIFKLAELFCIPNNTI